MELNNRFSGLDARALQSGLQICGGGGGAGGGHFGSSPLIKILSDYRSPHSSSYGGLGAHTFREGLKNVFKKLAFDQ